jgi:hypothetical protein
MDSSHISGCCNAGTKHTHQLFFWGTTSVACEKSCPYTFPPGTIAHVILLLSPCRGAANAAIENGGSCTFPYCGCYTAWPSECLELSNMTTSGQELSFTLISKCDQPLDYGCTQDVHKIEFNSCEWRVVGLD